VYTAGKQIENMKMQGPFFDEDGEVCRAVGAGGDWDAGFSGLLMPCCFNYRASSCVSNLFACPNSPLLATVVFDSKACLLTVRSSQTSNAPSSCPRASGGDPRSACSTARTPRPAPRCYPLLESADRAGFISGLLLLRSSRTMEPIACYCAIISFLVTQGDLKRVIVKEA